jgi:hypothetical protein
MKPITLFAAASVLLCGAAQHAYAAEAPTAADASVLVARADLPYHPDTHATMQPRSPGERGAMAAAAKGPDALRRYIQRTRMIYGLRYEDFARQ